MGNAKEIINNVLRNKNTITILLVFAGIIGLYAVYNWRVTEATTPVKVPIAKKTLDSRAQITDEDINYTEVPKSLVNSNSNLIKNKNQVVNHFVNNGWTIPEFSFFYTEDILKDTETPESEFANIPDGYTVYPLAVDFDTTYANSLYPGNYIDLYIKMNDTESKKIIFGRLIKGIKIMSVVDSDGNNVFESQTEARKPKFMFFAVPNEMFSLLKKSEYLNVTVLPIPRNESYSSEEREAEIDSVYIQNYILSKSIY